MSRMSKTAEVINEYFASNGEILDEERLSEHLDEIFWRGYSAGVRMEMGDGRRTDFDSQDEAASLLKNFNYASVNDAILGYIAEILDQVWDSGTAEGGFDS